MIVALSCLLSLPLSAPPVVIGQTVLHLQPDKPAAKPAGQPKKPSKPAPPDDLDDDDEPKPRAEAEPGPKTKPGRKKTAAGPEIVVEELIWANKAERYSFKYPKDWAEIPQNLVDAQTQLANRALGPMGAKVTFLAGLKPVSLTLPGFPYILVQQHPPGSPTHKQILKEVADGSFGETLDTVKEKLGPALSKASIDKPVLDKDRNILYFTIHLEQQQVSATGLCAVVLGKERIVQLNCYSYADRFEAMLPVFTRVINSVEFEPGYEYQGGTGGAGGAGGLNNFPAFDQLHPAVQRGLISGLVCGLIGAVVALLRGGRSRNYQSW